MKKEAQIELSFGMIFAIFLIVAAVAVTFYAIIYFVKSGKCVEIGLYYQDLKEEIDRAWASEITQKPVSGALPSAIEKVCFGSLESSYSGFEKEHENIERLSRRSTNNVFVYPAEKACGKESSSFNLEHVEIESFFCVDNGEEGAKIKLSKSASEALVKIEAAE